MKKLCLALAFLVVVGAAFAASRETRTTIGEWKDDGSTIVASVVVDGSDRKIALTAYDNGGINRVHFLVNAKQLKKLQGLLEEAQAEAAPPPK